MAQIVSKRPRTSVSTPIGSSHAAGNRIHTSAAPRRRIFRYESSDDDEQAAETRADSSRTQPAESGRDAPTLTLTDPDVLDCPICLEPLYPPVYQCENGHVTCEVCCDKMKRKCPTCGWPIGHNRCRAVEKILDSIKFSCPNAWLGCPETITLSKRVEHTKTCGFLACLCPMPDCTYMGSSNSVYSHFSKRHPNTSKPFVFNNGISISLTKGQKHVFLQESIAKTLFVINRWALRGGNLVSVVCLAPASCDGKFMYKVVAGDGSNFVKMKGFVETSACWMSGQTPGKKYFLVPNALLGLGGQLVVEVMIRRAV
ncbi:E3 ubiquitin-protein ligase SINA-like 10 [Striga hermonthica]|uniref:RING-type E3 ubiquitin transferase n=1 Tax=Striga hermonthica TaxID=68872 RepID=A0A9N7RK22_STRHE|nr:E3 ubiquitin-protein ligase SINA-like 10 [Striga hermonthica]